MHRDLLRGYVRRHLRAAVLAFLAVVPAIGLSSASGPALWSKVEFSAFTMLQFYLKADGINEITMWICMDGVQTERELYLRKSAGND